MKPPLENALARYAPLSDYRPQIGDFVIKAGMFSTLYGVVAGVSGDSAYIIFDRLPSLVFTSDVEEQKKATKIVSVGKIIMSTGTYSIMQYDAKAGSNVWYI